MKSAKSNLKRISISALFAAVICICSIFVVPFGSIPLTLSNFAVMLCAFTLPTGSAVSAVLVYLLLGLCSLPVFASFQGGAQVLFGVTGGFLWGYIPLALFCSLAKNVKESNLKIFLFVFIGLLCMYTLGVFQYCLICKVSFVSAVFVCVLPFVVFDIIKCVAAYFVAKRLRKIGW